MCDAAAAPSTDTGSGGGGGGGGAAGLCVRYAALVTVDAPASDKAEPPTPPRRSTCAAEGDEGGGAEGQNESESLRQCRMLLAFSRGWALIKDSVWSRKDAAPPAGTLGLARRKLLSLDPGTGAPRLGPCPVPLGLAPVLFLASSLFFSSFLLAFGLSSLCQFVARI